MCGIGTASLKCACSTDAGMIVVLLSNFTDFDVMLVNEIMDAASSSTTDDMFSVSEVDDKVGFTDNCVVVIIVAVVADDDKSYVFFFNGVDSVCVVNFVIDTDVDSTVGIDFVGVVVEIATVGNDAMDVIVGASPAAGVACLLPVDTDDVSSFLEDSSDLFFMLFIKLIFSLVFLFTT